MSASTNSSNLTKPPTIDKLSYTPDIANLWLLPDGVQDLLSSEAQKQEMLRYRLTRKLVGSGYELICPPMIEYTESLLGNASEDLKRQTFKIIDQLTGRLMGVRADITPQILRIDAHLNRDRDNHHIARYCYAGHVIHTLPSGLFGSRTPLQLGAEIFGCEGIEADIELLDRLYELFDTIGLNTSLHVDIGQVGIFKRLRELSGISDEQAEALMQLYANKALPELERLSKTLPMGSDFMALASAGHDIAGLSQALSPSVRNDAQVDDAIGKLVTIKTHLERTWQCQVSVDITELSGYHYHTGLVFNVYVGQDTQPVARGGRFEGMLSLTTAASNDQQAYEEPAKSSTRPATGFSLDLTRLQGHIDLTPSDFVVVDFEQMQALERFQDTSDAKEKLLPLEEKIQSLRAQGKRVIKPLTADDGQDKMTHRLVFEGENDEWVVIKA